MSLSFLVKILNYTYRPFASKMASSVYAHAGRWLQDQTATNADVYWRCHFWRKAWVIQNFNKERRDKVKFYFILIDITALETKNSLSQQN